MKFLVKGLVLTTAHLLVFIDSILCGHQGPINKPNFVIFLADDIGFGDLQSFGNPLSRTPNIDALERDGLKFTQFYSATSICTPSRAALLTGRYPVRSGMWNNENGSLLFSQTSIGGLPHSEITIPEMLEKQSYKSALIGKWHLGIGREREYLPIHHGFDDYFGIPVTHADCPCFKCFFPNDDCEHAQCADSITAPCQLLYNDVIIEQPVNLITLATRQARAARSWIQKYACDNTPFFLMYSFFHPHVPHFAGKRFRNSTIGGVYTDSLAELDWQIGEVIEELEMNGILDNTLIFITSDNGPALENVEEGGFSGVQRCGKGSTFDGGSRVPTIAYWRGRISSRVSTEFLTHMDIWPTLRSLSGALPEDFNVTLDGFDFSDVLLGNKKSRRNSFLFYSGKSYQSGPPAFRNQRYKIHFGTDNSEMCSQYSQDNDTYTFSPPLLFDLLRDPQELVDLGGLNESQSIIEAMTNLTFAEWDKVEFGISVFQEYDISAQLCCSPGCEPFPSCCVCVSNYTTTMFPLSRQCGFPGVPLHGHRKRNMC